MLKKYWNKYQKKYGLKNKRKREVLSFKRRIKTLEDYIIKLENILNFRYGIYGDEIFYNYNEKFVDFLNDSEFHKLDSKLSTFFGVIERFKLIKSLIILPFSKDISRLFDSYKKLQSRIDSIDGRSYRDKINFDGSEDYKNKSSNYYSFDNDEPSDHELSKIENHKK